MRCLGILRLGESMKTRSGLAFDFDILDCSVTGDAVRGGCKADA